jgi:hypothetical protein
MDQNVHNFFPYCTYKAQLLLYTARSSAFEIFEFCSVKKDFGFAPFQLHYITAKKTGLVLNYVDGSLIGGKTAMDGDE